MIIYHVKLERAVIFIKYIVSVVPFIEKNAVTCIKFAENEQEKAFSESN